MRISRPGGSNENPNPNSGFVPPAASVAEEPFEVPCNLQTATLLRDQNFEETFMKQFPDGWVSYIPDTEKWLVKAPNA
jgi:hypothetical protein